MGRYTLLLSSLLLLVLVAAACGGDGEDPNRVLLLKGGPITAEELLTAIRNERGSGGDILNPLCSASFISDEPTVMELVNVLQGGEEDATLEPSPADVSRAMEVVAEFCAYGLSVASQTPPSLGRTVSSAGLGPPPADGPQVAGLE